MTTPMIIPEVSNGRTVQLIKRDLDVNSPTYGQDLIVIDILGPNSGAQGICLLRGFGGFFHAPRTQIRESGAYQEGSTLSDFPRVDERILDFRLGVQGISPMDFENKDSLLWEVLSFTEDCFIRVGSQISPPRELKIRLERKPVDLFDLDPGVTKLMNWQITAIACDPWWYSKEIERSWTRSEGTLQDDGSWLGELELLNPADQIAWTEFASSTITVSETWTLPDALLKFPVGHPKAGQPLTHTLPLLTPGREFLVQTHPLAEQLLVMDDSLQWAKMKAEAFEGWLPRRTLPTKVPIRLLGGTANSKITAFILQRWDRPWGGH